MDAYARALLICSRVTVCPPNKFFFCFLSFFLVFSRLLRKMLLLLRAYLLAAAAFSGVAVGQDPVC